MNVIVKTAGQAPAEILRSAPISAQTDTQRHRRTRSCPTSAFAFRIPGTEAACHLTRTLGPQIRRHHDATRGRGVGRRTVHAHHRERVQAASVDSHRELHVPLIPFCWITDAT